MMLLAGIIVAALLMGWLRHRASRKAELSGLSSDRPVFSVEPPTRRMGSRKGERL